MTEVIENTPVVFTDAAMAEIKRLSQENPSQTVRVGVKGGGCTGMTYVLEFDDKAEDDTVFEVDAIPFLMKNSHGIYLQGMTIDFGTGLDARGFIFTNPNASETCGCGQSFAV